MISTAQMQRLEQFLVYSDDSQRQIETVNLLVRAQYSGHLRATGLRGDLGVEPEDEIDPAEVEALPDSHPRRKKPKPAARTRDSQSKGRSTRRSRKRFPTVRA